MGRLDIQEMGEIGTELVTFSAADGEDDFVDVAGSRGEVVILVTSVTEGERTVTVSPAERHAGMPDSAELAEDMVRVLQFDDLTVLGPFAPAYIDRDGCVRVTYSLADGVNIAAISVGG